MTKKSHKGMLFGVFDGFHEGHQNMLHQALELVERLTVVVALDESVQAFKGRSPKHGLVERITVVEAFSENITAIPGDSEQGVYTALESVKPNVLFIGYDQTALKESLELHLSEHSNPVPIVELAPYKPEVYKSSLLHKYD